MSELFESIRVPFGPFFVRLDVRRASKSLSGRDEGFHSSLLEAVREMRKLGLPALRAFVISDEINVLVGEVFSRRVEKIVSLFASVASIKISKPLDARIVYTPSLLSAIEYLSRRQELGNRNAILKEAYEEALRRLRDPRKAHESLLGKPIDRLRREYSRRIPRRALLGSIYSDEPREAYEFSSEKGRRKLYEELRSIKASRLESRIRSV